MSGKRGNREIFSSPPLLVGFCGVRYSTYPRGVGQRSPPGPLYSREGPDYRVQELYTSVPLCSDSSLIFTLGVL